MAVTARTREDGKLELILDKGDSEKLQEVIERWNLKNEQAFLRFTVSLMLETDETIVGIMDKGRLVPIVPADHSFKKEE